MSYYKGCFFAPVRSVLAVIFLSFLWGDEGGAASLEGNKPIASREAQFIVNELSTIQKAASSAGPHVKCSSGHAGEHSVVPISVSQVDEKEARFQRQLEQAGVVEVTKLGADTPGKQQGINVTYLLQLNNNMKGYFKVKNNPRRQHLNEYQHEIMAYRLDRLLGFGLVPVTVSKQVKIERNLVEGSFQLHHAGLEAQKVSGHIKSHRLLLLDYLLGNCDRTSLNYLIHGEEESAIDNGMAFDRNCYPTLPKSIPPDVLLKMSKVTDAIYKDHLPLLKHDELSEFLRRKNCIQLLAAQDAGDEAETKKNKHLCGINEIVPVQPSDSRVSKEFQNLGKMVQIGDHIWSGKAEKKMTLLEAEKYCKSLGRFVRLPYRDEYESLGRSMGRETKSGYNQGNFPGEIGDSWIAPDPEGPRKPYVFNSLLGTTGFSFEDEQKEVRCVTDVYWNFS